MKRKKINKKKGILFWITGLSGSGKTSLAKKIKKDISKKYGPTIIISGDNLRSIFCLNKYDYKSYDGSDVPRYGRIDQYPPLSVPAEFTTAAMAEGAIEGAAKDYEVADKYATQFRFSRFAP